MGTNTYPANCKIGDHTNDLLPTSRTFKNELFPDSVAARLVGVSANLRLLKRFADCLFRGTHPAQPLAARGGRLLTRFETD